MHAGKELQPKYFSTCVRFFVSLILLLALLGNSPVLALLLNRPAEGASDLGPVLDLGPAEAPPVLPDLSITGNTSPNALPP